MQTGIHEQPSRIDFHWLPQSARDAAQARFLARHLIFVFAQLHCLIVWALHLPERQRDYAWRRLGMSTRRGGDVWRSVCEMGEPKGARESAVLKCLAVSLR